MSRLNEHPYPSGQLLLERIACYRDRPFLIDSASNRILSYGEFHGRACAMASEFSRRGIRRGERVALLMPNSVEFAVGYFACFYLGATAVPINPNLNLQDIQYILRDARISLVVHTPATATKLPAKEGGDRLCLSLLHPRQNQEDRSGGMTLTTLASPPRDWQPFLECREEDPVVVVYTSGTTARPKGIAHRLSSLVGNAMAFGAIHGIDEDHRFYLILSMAYMGGFYNLFLLPFLHGSSVVIDEVFGARASIAFWEKPMAYGVNALWLAPTLMAVLLKMDRGLKGESFCREKVKLIFSGFAPLSLKTKQEFEERYGVPVLETYGLSETLFVSTNFKRFQSPEGSVGKMLPKIEVAILAEEAPPLPEGLEGEIALKTPYLMLGYLNEEGEIRSEDPQRWFLTGDYGRITQEGHLFITGRKKDLIIRGGINVSPAAIEEVLRGFPGIGDVAVVSTPHDLYGEDITAVLRLEAGIELDSIRSALVAHAQRHLAPHQQPSRYLGIDQFPMTPSGKMRKTHLRDLVIHQLQLKNPPENKLFAVRPISETVYGKSKRDS